MGRIGFVRWIMNISTFGPSKVDSLPYIFPSKIWEPKIVLITLYVTKLSPQNVHKVGLDRGLNAHESGWCSGWPLMASSRRLSCGGRDSGLNALEFVTAILAEYTAHTH